MLLIGKIIGTRGLKGEVKIYPYTNAPEDFDRIERVYLNEDPAAPLVLKKQKMQKNLIFAFFEGIDSIEQAEELKQSSIYLDDVEAERFLAGDSYFYKDVIGFDVITEDRKFVGKVKEVVLKPKQDLFLVEKGGKEWLLPNVKQFIKEVNLGEKQISVDLIEGLIDED